MSKQTELTWDYNPWSQRPTRTFAAVAVIGALTALFHFSFELSALMTLLAGLVLVVAIFPILVPVHYRIDGDGVDIGLPLHTVHYPWEAIERISVDRHAVQIRTEGTSVTGKRIHEMFHPEPEELFEDVKRLAGEKLKSGTLYDREGERVTGKSMEEREEEEVIPPRDDSANGNSKRNPQPGRG